ncbi:MAG: acyltransferase family protein [Fuerstiella sp.]|nr:acyltransferase family protein [Fuerstiella sp.]MCP4853563.1 acyltransferase family protein [Fuerstiella sp.]
MAVLCKSRLYSVKQTTHWFWRKNLTREQVFRQLEDSRITRDWLICPLGDAGNAISVADFETSPDVFARNNGPTVPDSDDTVLSEHTDGKGQSEPPATMPRRHDLDALRAIAMLLGIVLHGALAYMPIPEAVWPVQDVHQSHAYGIFLAAVHGFRMPLFFLISGFFTAMLWRKRGLAALIKHRGNRILKPMLISMLTIMPVVWIAGEVAKEGAAPALNNDAADIWAAAARNDTEGLKHSLAGGISPNELKPVFGATALSTAAAHGNMAAIELLIANGADVNARSRDGATPLHAAAMYGRAEAARVLIQHGAGRRAKNRIGETPADMLKADATRMLILTVLTGIPSDDLTGREEVSQMLAKSDQLPTEQLGSSQAREPIESDTKAATPQPPDELFLLMLLPLLGHLWFLWFLCWLVAAFALYTKAATPLKWKPSAWWATSSIRYVWLIPLTIVPQSMMGLLFPNFGPDTSAGLLPMPHILLYYAIFFFFGAIYFDCNDVVGRVGRWWRVTLPVALLVIFPIGYEVSMGGLGFLGNDLLDSGWCRPLAVVLQVVYAWLMSFGLMGLFRDLFSREDKTMRYISDSSYWLYLAHLPLIIILQAVIRSWPIPAFAKLTMVCTVTTVLLLASYQLFVRYTLIGTMLNGPRKRPESIVGSEAIDARS